MNKKKSNRKTIRKHNFYSHKNNNSLLFLYGQLGSKSWAKAYCYLHKCYLSPNNIKEKSCRKKNCKYFKEV